MSSVQPIAESGAGPRTLVVADEPGLGPYLDAWDRLAVACERPFCAPAWMLAWWRQARSGDARLRVTLALEGEEVLAVAPFFAQVAYGLNELRLLAAGFSHRIGIVAEPGREEEAARLLAPALAAIEPAPASLVFEGIDAADPWPELLAAAWPGRRPRLRTDATMEAPTIDLGASYEAWMEGRARKFRKEARRNARRLEEEGVGERIGADPEAISALLRLHELRWEDRGGSDVGPESERVLTEAAAGLGAEGRLEVVLLEGPDGPVSAELLLRAGDAAAFWAGGFDPAWSRHAPGTQTMLVALRSAAERGVTFADLGGGDHPYKRRMADGSRPLAWRTLFPRGRRYPLIRLRLAPKHLRQALRGLAKRLPPGLCRPLDRLRSR
ncbi:MAG TPA: GNAT family N-acetyltransferase [Solirubrobacterales bacterium]|nr:GNAT family N-acetyltransferase [Solirubrobacterales bacterium]